MTNELNLKDRVHHILKEALNIISGYDDVYLGESIRDAERRIDTPMQLAIIGKISSSKSTLVNAILGEPEVVRTGQMEETFNVSWLKYGDSNSDIKVVFKTGEVSLIPRKEWSKWASHQAENRLKENVKYIEVKYQHEILKNINIIDTPGLDALTQIDSKNTIEFLKDIKPDAVVMLFTKSIAESTLSVLQDFQNVGANDYNLSALNAIGVLAKIDTMWTATSPDKNILEEANRVIEKTLIDKYTEVRKSLFSILPVSSLIGLASSILSDADVKSLVTLCSIEHSKLLEMLSSPTFFIDDEYSNIVSVEERRRLYDKFGLYGVYVLTETLNRNKDVSITFLRDILRLKSGFDKLLFTIQSHFGKRATLIKSQNILQSLLHKITICKSRCSTSMLSSISEVENLIISTLLQMHEYREWEYLSKYYDGKLQLDEEVADEFVSVCGEHGYSASERLRCKGENNPEKLIEIATSRALYWQKQYNIFSVIEPEKGNFYKVLISSYNILLHDIRSAQSEYDAALATLEKTSSFLGINSIK
jgi:hypothetical protein